MEHLNLFYLKCFLDAVHMGSISEAARRNFVSQSAVSQAIRKLEVALGVELCTHQKQQFEATEEGKLIVRQAEQVFSAVRGLYDALDRHKESPQSPIHFVTTHSLGLSLFPDYLINFRLLYPDIDVHFQFGGISQIKGWLKQGIFEFAIVLADSHFSEFQSLSLYEGSFSIYKHPKETKGIEEKGVCVENRSGFMVTEFQKAYFKLHQTPFPFSHELNSWEFIVRSMEYQKGFGLLPDFIVKQKRYSSFLPIPEPSLPYQIHAVFYKGRSLSYSSTIFLEQLQKHLLF